MIVVLSVLWMQRFNTGTAEPLLQLPPQKLQINPRHPLIRRLAAIRTEQPEVALLAAEQLLNPVDYIETVLGGTS